MIPHKYVNASDAPGHYAADHLRVPRQAITVAFYWHNCVDMPVWRYDAEAAECGLDPWRILDGHIDAHVNGRSYFVGSHEVEPNFEVYVQRRDLERERRVCPLCNLPDGSHHLACDTTWSDHR